MVVTTCTLLCVGCHNHALESEAAGTAVARLAEVKRLRAGTQILGPGRRFWSVHILAFSECPPAAHIPRLGRQMDQDGARLVYGELVDVGCWQPGREVNDPHMRAPGSSPAAIVLRGSVRGGLSPSGP
jgi:hypothetical protein